MNTTRQVTKPGLIKQFRHPVRSSQPPCHRGCKRTACGLSVFLTLFLQLPTTTFARPGQRRLPPRAEAVERVRELEEWRKTGRENSAEYERKLKEAEDRFGLHAGLLQKPAPPPGAVIVPFEEPAGKLRTLAIQRPWPMDILEAQQRLSKLGYLDPKVDVDGTFGPRTRKSLERFQEDHGLPVTGKLDFTTQATLRPVSLRYLAENKGLRDRINKEIEEIELSPVTTHILEYLRSNLAVRYRLMDASGQVLFWSDDPTELVAEVNKLSSDGAHHSIYVEMKGFSEDKAEALATTLRLQQRQIDPSVSIGVIPHIAESPSARDALFTHGIRRESSTVEIEKIESGKEEGKYRANLSYSFGRRQEMRGVLLIIISVARELLEEFLALVNLRNPAGTFDEGQSLAELVDGARQELKAKHKELTDEDLQIKITDQFGNIQMVLVPDRIVFAWS